MQTWDIIRASLPTLFQGLVVTLQLTIISLVLATCIGLIMGLLRISQNKILSLLAVGYVYLIRGTPLLVQILFIYYGIPKVLDIRLTAFTAGVIAVSLNAGAYLVEIFRAGIESIERGQMEAGRSLGFTYGQTMRLIILPQAVRRMIPALRRNWSIFIFASVSRLPSIRISPEVGFSSKFMQRRRVLFPEPDGPITQTTS